MNAGGINPVENTDQPQTLLDYMEANPKLLTEYQEAGIKINTAIELSPNFSYIPIVRWKSAINPGSMVFAGIIINTPEEGKQTKLSELLSAVPDALQDYLEMEANDIGIFIIDLHPDIDIDLDQAEMQDLFQTHFPNVFFRAHGMDWIEQTNPYLLKLGTRMVNLKIQENVQKIVTGLGSNYQLCDNLKIARNKLLLKTANISGALPGGSSNTNES